jgi:hypothetical protein
MDAMDAANLWLHCNGLIEDHQHYSSGWRRPCTPRPGTLRWTLATCFGSSYHYIRYSNESLPADLDELPASCTARA